MRTRLSWIYLEKLFTTSLESGSMSSFLETIGLTRELKIINTYYKECEMRGIP